jgi:hypothetical protein
MDMFNESHGLKRSRSKSLIAKAWNPRATDQSPPRQDKDPDKDKDSCQARRIRQVMITILFTTICAKVWVHWSRVPNLHLWPQRECEEHAEPEDLIDQDLHVAY